MSTPKEETEPSEVVTTDAQTDAQTVAQTVAPVEGEGTAGAVPTLGGGKMEEFSPATYGGSGIKESLSHADTLTGGKRRRRKAKKSKKKSKAKKSKGRKTRRRRRGKK